MLLSNGYGVKDKLLLVMIQEVKEPLKDLLIKDLCARLSYGVVIQEKCLEHDETFFPYAEDNKVVNIDVHEDLVITSGGSWHYIEDIKPYLFPLSSITEEHKKEISKRYNLHTPYGLCVEITNHSEGYWDDDNSCHLQDYLWLVDWFNKNHFDYRGLISMGLAIDATGLNIY